jgi:hypothetical protein
MLAMERERAEEAWKICLEKFIAVEKQMWLFSCAVVIFSGRLA